MNQYDRVFKKTIGMIISMLLIISSAAPVKAAHGLLIEEVELILDQTSNINKKITFNMIIGTYGKEIFKVIFIAIGILLVSVILNIRAKRKLEAQNQKYEVLSHISNEYLYEYNAKTNHLELSEKFSQILTTPKAFEEVTKILKDVLSNDNKDDYNKIMKLPIGNDEMGIFKSIHSKTYDNHGRLDFIIGKLMDVRAEVAEKEELLAKSQVDGLTGLYNATTTKDNIVKKINHKKKHEMDAFILLDCDNFKDINDTYGHLVGNQILQYIAESLKQTFRNTDIIGRIGGDEFCVYIKNIPSVSFLKEKHRQLSNCMERSNEGVNISISVGIVLVGEKDIYNNIFKKADDALYQAKKNGKAQAVIYNKARGYKVSSQF